MSNTGKTLKYVAIVWEGFLCFGALYGGAYLLEYGDSVYMGIAVILGGFLFALVSGLVLYGFGIIVERVEMDAKGDGSTRQTLAPAIPANCKRCPQCGNRIGMYDKHCTSCGHDLKAASTDDWRCTCGKTNPKYVSTCSCGKSAREVREMKN